MGRWISRLGGVFDRARRDRDLADELNAHLDSHIQDNISRGLAPDAARREALLRLGGTDMTTEAYRDQRGIPAVEACLRELRQAFSRLRRSPAFTVAAVLSLALAVAANVAIFAVVERVLINPLPYPSPDRLVMLDFSMPARNIPSGFNSMTQRQYLQYAGHAQTLEALAIVRGVDQTLGGGTAERIRVARTTPSLVSVLRVQPALGTWLTGGPRNGGAPTAVLSHGLWVRRYGADTGVLGRSVPLNGVPTTIVGVMPASFVFPDPAIEMWTEDPLAASDMESYMFLGVARLKPGVQLAQMRAEIDQLSLALQAEAPGQGYNGVFSTALPLRDYTIGPIATTLWILLASAAVVLLVGCANIANLFLVRSEARQREIGVRRALGAGTRGIAAYFFAESALLSLAGALIGLAASWYAVQALVQFGPVTLPRLHEVRLAPIHLLFTGALAAVTTLVFGLVPLLRLGSSNAPLQDGARGATTSRRSQRTRQILMAGQVALALVLLVASGLLFRSFVRLRAIDPGFDASSALTFQIGLPRNEYTDRAKLVRAHQAILDRVEALPGVTFAAAVNCVPISGRGFCGGAPLFIEGEPVRAGGDWGGRPIVAARPITPAFFDAMGMRLLAGRGFTRADMDGSELVAVINDTLAKTAFPGQNPLGKRIRLGPHVQPTLWFTIVGVVRTTPTISLTEPSRVPKMYVPMFATKEIWPRVDVMTYVVKTSVPPLDLASAARNAVTQVDPNLALAQVRTLQDYLDAAAAPRAFTLVLIAIAATTALLLGIVGIYGVMSYIVSQRTSEIGVRIALGAEPRNVTRMIVAQGGAVALAGVAAGLAASLAGSRLLATLLYDVSPRDPGVFAVTALALFGVAIVACWIPARRAAAVDPLQALRAQ